MVDNVTDRVREQVSGASGTGPWTLPNAAVPGFQTFLSGWGASGTGDGCVVIGSQWQTGLFTINAGGTSLTCTTPYNGSSGAGVAVNFSTGTMDCFCDPPAELSHYLNMREITVASATTCDIGAVSGSNIIISGTTTITGFGNKKNRRRYVRFAGALTLTHNGTSLILPGAVNITTVAGDTAIFQSEGTSGNWRCVSYARGSGLAINKIVTQVITSSGTYTPSPGMVFTIAKAVGGGGGGGGASGDVAKISQGGGGASGGHEEARLTAAQIGTSQTVTIGAAGAAGSAGNNAGGAGGDTSVGALLIAKGGAGGGGAVAGGGGTAGAGGGAGTGDFHSAGMAGGGGVGSSSVGTAYPSTFGGSSLMGGGAAQLGAGASAGGGTGVGPGGGGGGGVAYANASDRAGGAGFRGEVRFTDFCSV